MSATVTRFIVQERWVDDERESAWTDDTAQPRATKATSDDAKAWLSENTSFAAHARIYSHRIIERTDRVVFEQPAKGA